MSSLILCHKKKAKQPYTITRIHRRIYTIEELCYYLCNNIYLIDDTIMNEQLCIWLSEELEMTELSRKLREHLAKHSSIECFVLAILIESSIYLQTEINHINHVLDKLKNEKEIERQKSKADSLLENGEIEEAILTYQAILNKKQEEMVPKQFYGKIYGCLGAAFGRLFLYEESMDMYDRAFQVCTEPSMLSAYIYAAYRALKQEDYELLLEKSNIYRDMDDMLKKELEEVRKEVREQVIPSEEVLESWKKQYRRSHS